MPMHSQFLWFNNMDSYSWKDIVILMLIGIVTFLVFIIIGGIALYMYYNLQTTINRIETELNEKDKTVNKLSSQMERMHYIQTFAYQWEYVYLPEVNAFLI